MGASPTERVVLRGGTIVSAPLTLLGVVAAVVALLAVLWWAGADADEAGSGPVVAAVAAACSAACVAAARGCRVRVTDGTVEDVVAWRTVHRCRCGDIEAVRVRRGPWRVYEMELADRTRRVVLGAGPQQFPASLLPDASARDVAAIDTMMGPDARPGGAAGSAARA
jgi:hypothetical protein